MICGRSALMLTGAHLDDMPKKAFGAMRKTSQTDGIETAGKDYLDHLQTTARLELQRRYRALQKTWCS